MSKRMVCRLIWTVFAVCLTVGLTELRAQAQTWVDEISNSLNFYTTNYPGSNWQPYHDKLNLVRDAVDRGDQRIVKTEMTKWFKMLRHRDHGISDVAADELYNFGLMVAPIQEYGISVPAASGGGADYSY